MLFPRVGCGSIEKGYFFLVRHMYSRLECNKRSSFDFGENGRMENKLFSSKMPTKFIMDFVPPFLICIKRVFKIYISDLAILCQNLFAALDWPNK